MSSSSANIALRIVFVFFVAAYAIIFLIAPQLGPTDDIVFLRTLQQGKPLLYYSQAFPYYETANLGRFVPLVAMEYNLVGFFSKTPRAYFAYHALQFILLIVLLVMLAKQLGATTPLTYGAIVLLCLLPAFTFAWFRLQLPERNALFFYTAFLLTYLAFLRKPTVGWAGFSLIFANIAIYYKEAAFVAIGAFAFARLVLTWRQADWRKRCLDLTLLISAILYLLLYYLLVFRHSLPFIFRHPANRTLLVFIKNFFNFAFFSDPLLLLLILPLALWRWYQAARQRLQLDPLIDSLLLATLAYVGIFFILNLFQPYYLLPAYAFALPALLGLFGQQPRLGRTHKLALALIGLILLTITLPAGLHFLTYHKYLPVNFNATLDFLQRDLARQPNKKPPAIFFDGIDLAGGRGTYFILAEFLTARGVPFDRYDLRSNTPTPQPEPLVSKISYPFAVFTSDATSTIRPGDYLIIAPQSPKQITPAYLSLLEADYRLVFQTKSPFALPMLNAKTLLKTLLIRRLSSSQRQPGLIKNENLLDLPDYYVFRKK